LTDSLLSAAASRISADQSKAIPEHFGSALESVVSDPRVRDLVIRNVGSRIPGALSGLL